MINLIWLCQVINKLFKKKWKDGEENMQKWKNSIQSQLIRSIGKKHCSKVNLSFWNNKEILQKKILKMLKIIFKLLQSNYKDLILKVKIKLRLIIKYLSVLRRLSSIKELRNFKKVKAYLFKSFNRKINSQKEIIN